MTCDPIGEADDLSLVRSYQQSGCERAREILVARHVGAVRNLIYSMVLDANMADDLTQETWLKALRHLPRFNGQAAFSTWLFRIAMNTTYTCLARSRRIPQSLESQHEDELGTHMPPDREALRAELDAAIAASLSALSPKLRGAIVLTTVQGLSTLEAAKIEGCSIGTMYWRIHTARKLMQKRLREWLE